MRLLVKYFEMTVPPAGSALLSPDKDAIVARECLSREEYLALYKAIGDPVQWDERFRIEPAELNRMLSSEFLEVFILRISGKAVGLCEFDKRKFPDIELVNYGLLTSFQGRGLGVYLLDQSLRKVWNCCPNRVWLHTDTNDHPRAALTYERAGFKEYISRYEDFPDELAR